MPAALVVTETTEHLGELLGAQRVRILIAIPAQNVRIALRGARFAEDTARTRAEHT